MNLTIASDKDFILKLRVIILENLDNENFGVAELVRETGMNRSNIYRKVKAITKKSVSQFIREVRLRKAMEMLLQKETTISEISYKVGFGSPAYFNTCFHEYFGFPPGDVKKRSMQGENLEEEYTALDIYPDPISHVNKDRKGKLSFRYRLSHTLLAVALLIILVPGTYILASLVRGGSTAGYLFNLFQPVEKSIAVLPFRNLGGDPENLFLADGIMEDISNNLIRIKKLRVVSRTSTEQFRGTVKSIREIGKKLRVSYILEGTVQDFGNDVRVVVKLTDVRREQQIWSEKYDGSSPDRFLTQSDIAEKVTLELQRVLSIGRTGKVTLAKTKNPEAYQFYLKGRASLYQRTRKGYENSIVYFEKSVAADHENALAWSGLATAYYSQALMGNIPGESGFKKAREMADNALHLDKSLAEAHAILGGILTWNDWEWDQAQSALVRAIELNPNCASAHYYYAELLEVTNKKAEAREQLNDAIVLDPMFFWYHLVSSIFYYYEGRYKESLAACASAEELNPDYDGIHRQFFHIYYKMGENDKAAASFQRLLLCHPDSSFRKHAKMAGEIYKERGIEGLLNWKIGLEAGRNKPLTLFIASSYAMLGERELALIRLEEALNTHSMALPWINVDPDFDNLRSEPRFRELIRQLKLSDFHPVSGTGIAD